jgi:hypothetical protein
LPITPHPEVPVNSPALAQRISSDTSRSGQAKRLTPAKIGSRMTANKTSGPIWPKRWFTVCSRSS